MEKRTLEAAYKNFIYKNFRPAHSAEADTTQPNEMLLSQFWIDITRIGK